MLFESFSIELNYQGTLCELEIRENYSDVNARAFEIIQGGIHILLLMFKDGTWTMYVVDGLHPVVKQDTESFVTKELVELLISAIINYYDCFTDQKLIYKRSQNVWSSNIW